MDLGESSIDFGESGIDFGISDITLETGGVQAEDAIQVSCSLRQKEMTVII